MKGITWNGEELGASFDVGDIPESMKEQVRVLASALAHPVENKPMN